VRRLGLVRPAEPALMRSRKSPVSKLGSQICSCVSPEQPDNASCSRPRYLSLKLNLKLWRNIPPDAIRTALISQSKFNNSCAPPAKPLLRRNNVPGPTKKLDDA